MACPTVAIQLSEKGSYYEVYCHTIDPELESFIGKDESDQFLRFDKDQMDKVLKIMK